MVPESSGREGGLDLQAQGVATNVCLQKGRGPADLGADLFLEEGFDSGEVAPVTEVRMR
ncbi:MAG: hypothetical protein R3F31_23060 [Verrucomicrobiales bacterium]